MREFLREDPPNWQSADEATQWLMQQLAPFSEGRIDSPNCGKIEKINKLWTEASDDKLGFTAQAQIFMEVDRDPKAYYERIEWLDICQAFDLNSTVISNMGILPTPPFSEIDDRKVGVLSIPILSKTDELISGILPLPPSENLEFPKTVLIPNRINFENQLKKSITQIEKSLESKLYS